MQCLHLAFVREFIKEWNDHKIIKINVMYLSKENEWEVILFGSFKIKEIKNGKYVILFGNNKEEK